MAASEDDRLEMEAIAHALVVRVWNRDIPAADAYAWVVVICEMARPWRRDDEAETGTERTTSHGRRP